MIPLSQPAPEPLLNARSARRSFFEARFSQSSAALIAASGNLSERSKARQQANLARRVVAAWRGGDAARRRSA